MYSVTREIHFSYGHRIVGHQGKCANLHGHNAKVQIEVGAEELDELNMVVDFSEIEAKIGKWIDEHLDHKMILWKEDPACDMLREKGEVFTEVEQNPTAEFFAKLIYDEAKKQGLPVRQVVIWETENSSASYRG